MTPGEEANRGAELAAKIVQPNLAPFFDGLQPRWLSPDRLYRIYISAQRLAGAYIAGQFYDQRSARLQLQQVCAGMRHTVERWLRERQEREFVYSRIDVFAPELLQLDARNFHIQRQDVHKLLINWRRSLWTAVNSGKLTITDAYGQRRRFVLVGEQAPEELLAILREFCPTVDTKGRPRVRRL